MGKLSETIEKTEHCANSVLEALVDAPK